jgi:hypothetical protein
MERIRAQCNGFCDPCLDLFELYKLVWETMALSSELPDREHRARFRSQIVPKPTSCPVIVNSVGDEYDRCAKGLTKETHYSPLRFASTIASNRVAIPSFVANLSVA